MHHLFVYTDGLPSSAVVHAVRRLSAEPQQNAGLDRLGVWAVVCQVGFARCFLGPSLVSSFGP